jgi:uncharacterized protein DUF177 involved in 23S rRNA accumulation
MSFERPPPGSPGGAACPARSRLMVDRASPAAREQVATMVTSRRPWSVPVAIHDIPDTGRRFDLVADEAARDAVAAVAGLRSLPRLQAAFDLVRRGRAGVHVVGTVSARVGQTCIITLEPIKDDIEAPVDLVFAPLQQNAEEHAAAAPEPLVDGTVDLGAVATEFLVLAVDPYPRKEGAVFQAPPTSDAGAHPFAALAALKKGDGGTDK